MFTIRRNECSRSGEMGVHVGPKYAFKPLITAALVGISGHMGSRAIFQLERWAQARFGHRDHDGDGK
ncbi:MAG: hypothetical protein AB1409_13870, partial [Pseudomonadota bacterium]